MPGVNPRCRQRSLRFFVIERAGNLGVRVA